jgi:hypothetical protein
VRLQGESRKAVEEIGRHVTRLAKFDRRKDELGEEWEACRGKRGAPYVRKSINEEWRRIDAIEKEIIGDLYDAYASLASRLLGIDVRTVAPDILDGETGKYPSEAASDA